MPAEFAAEKVLGKSPEAAVHGHQQRVLADVADARPLGVPAVRAVVAVAGLGQAEGVPLAAVEQHEDERAMIPADAPEAVVAGRIAVDATGTGDIGELVAADDGPLVGLAVPLGQARR